MSTPILRVRDAQGNYIPIPAIQGRDGVDGKDGKDGKDGAAGPNQINQTTLTPLTGILMGSGGSVKTAVSGADYATPAAVAAKVGKDDYTRTINTATTTGTAASYVLTLEPAPSALVQGMLLLVNFHVGSETTVTPPSLNVNGTGAKYLFPVGQTSGKPFPAGLHIIFYDGTHWRMMDNAFLPIIGGTVHGSIVPISQGYNLGTTNNPWGHMHAKYAHVDGNDVWHKGNLKIASGEVSVQTEAPDEQKQVNVNISSYGFSSPPKVFLNCNTSWVKNARATASNQSTTQFSITYLTHNVAASFDISWLAIGL